jgi:hypothetical protein
LNETLVSIRLSSKRRVYAEHRHLQRSTFALRAPCLGDVDGARFIPEFFKYFADRTIRQTEVLSAEAQLASRHEAGFGSVRSAGGYERLTAASAQSQGLRHAGTPR